MMIKKLLLIPTIWLLLVSISFTDGGEIYLPIITKSGDCMPSNAILEITDGTAGGTIDLLQIGIGLAVDGWNPASPPLIPAMQSSPFTDGSDPSSYKFGNATETIDFKAGSIESSNTQDTVIEMVQDFRRILIQGINYHVVDWHNSIVYIRARASCETKIRYAAIKTYSLPEDDDPYQQPFIGSTLMDGMSVLIERGDWLGAIPGVGECQLAEAIQAFDASSWALEYTYPTINVHSVVETGTGRLLAGGEGEIIKSDDDGDTWAIFSADPNGPVMDLLVIGTRIWGADNDQVIYSDDDGANWSVSLANVDQFWSLLRTNTGRIIAGQETDIFKTDNNGASWQALTWPGGDDAPDLFLTNDNSILLAVGPSAGGGSGAGPAGIHKSEDNGDTWTRVLYNQEIFSFLQLPDGMILAGGDGQVFASSNDGDTWSRFDVNSSINGDVRGLVRRSSDGKIIMGERMDLATNDDAYKISDDGSEWVDMDTGTVTAQFNCFDLIEVSTGTLIGVGTKAVGGEGEIDRYAPNTIIDFGSEESCNRILYMANKHNIAQLSHIFVDDGGVFGSNLIPTTVFPVDLLPAAPAVNDAIYFGSDTSVIVSGPFSSVVFDIGTAMFASSWTITWEYWNGAWVALTVTDNTEEFGIAGVNSVHWVQPSDWATTAVNGVTAYWVRARLSALGVITTVPTQDNRNMYSIVTSFLQVNEESIGGDIPALAEFKIYNESDKDGKSGSAPNLWSNRIYVGLRSLYRGDNFRTFINISDEQNVIGVTVTAGTNATFGNDVTTPTGRRLTYGALAGDTTFVDRAIITMSSSIVRDYYGKFHVFIRGRQVSGAAGDITLRIQVRTGSGGITFTTAEQTFSGTNDWELLDFDAFTIPAGGRVITPSELGDTGVIAIQAKNDSASGRDVYIYDMVLIPTDEWAGDFTDLADIDDSIIGQQDNVKHFIDIDSVRNPKVLGRSVVRLDDANESISANYEFDTNGEVILQANADQRVWAVSAYIGSNDEWISEPWVGWSIQVFKNQRYLTQRGSR